MTRVWTTGLVMSLAVHLAVATVLLLALDLQPAGQQPRTGTRLNVSAVGVPHNRALPRLLPARPLLPLPQAGRAVAPLAMQPVPAPDRPPVRRAAVAGAPQGVTLAERALMRARVASAAPQADRIQALAADGPARAATEPSVAALAATTLGAARRAARTMPEQRGRALPVSGVERVAATAPADRMTAERPEGRDLSARPAATVPAAAASLRLSRLRATRPGGVVLAADRLPARQAPAVLGAGARLAMIPARVSSDARPLVPTALALRVPPAPRGPQRGLAGQVLPPSPLAPLRAVPPARPMSRAPARPMILPEASAASPAAAVTALTEHGLPWRRAPSLRADAPQRRAAAPAQPARPASLLWSGATTPDPASLAALRALTGATGTDALIARAEIERALAEQPCSRVQARLDRAGPRLVLSGHVPDLRAAGALMAALRGSLGPDLPLTAELATLPRPLCAQVARIAALGLHPSEPDDALGAVVQSGGMPQDGARALRLPGERGGFVHVDLYEASGEVVHLRPAPGTLPARHMPGDTLRLDLPRRAGQGAAVLSVLVTSRPLYLWPRAAREPGQVYLRFLANQTGAMRQAAGVSGGWGYSLLPAVPEGG